MGARVGVAMVALEKVVTIQAVTPHPTPTLLPVVAAGSTAAGSRVAAAAKTQVLSILGWK